jgi:hypothetical protein
MPYLGETTWTGKVKIYQLAIDEQGSSSAKFVKNFSVYNKSMLKCCWHNEQPLLFCGDNEGVIHSIDLKANQQITVGRHPSPINSLHYN